MCRTLSCVYCIFRGGKQVAEMRLLHFPRIPVGAVPWRVGAEGRAAASRAPRPLCPRPPRPSRGQSAALAPRPAMPLVPTGGLAVPRVRPRCSGWLWLTPSFLDSPHFLPLPCSQRVMSDVSVSLRNSRVPTSTRTDLSAHVPRPFFLSPLAGTNSSPRHDSASRSPGSPPFPQLVGPAPAIRPFLCVTIPISIQHAAVALIFQTKRNWSKYLFLIPHFSPRTFLLLLLNSEAPKKHHAACCLSCHSCSHWLLACSAPARVTTYADVSDIWHSCSHSPFWNTVYLARGHHSLP